MNYLITNNDVFESIKHMDEKEVEEKPKYVIFENISNITSKVFKDTLDLFKNDLEELG